MAIRYSVLASGSGGNCVWVRGGGTEILIDCGISARAIRDRMAVIGEDIGRLSAVFCTHGHLDHVAGAALLAKRYHVTVYGTRPTLRRIPGRPHIERLRKLRPGEPTMHGGLVVHNCPTPHDAPGSLAFVVSDGESSLGVVTDLGRGTRDLVEHLRQADELVLESNYDPDMLRDGPYPARLQQRVRSDVGHLSNAQSAALLAAINGVHLRRVTLAHLSAKNNTPELALEAAAQSLAGAMTTPVLRIAYQDTPTPPVTIAASCRPAPRARGQISMPW